MTTKRRPLRRDLKRRITPEAIDAFRRMEALRAACTCAPRDWAGEYWKHRQCASCEEWWAVHNVLHGGLGLKPWEWPAIEHPEAGCPYPEGSFAARQWKRDERGVELYCELAQVAA